MGAREQSSQVDRSSKQMAIPHGWNHPGRGQAASWGGPPPPEGMATQRTDTTRGRGTGWACTNCSDYLEDSRFISPMMQEENKFSCDMSPVRT